MEKVENLYCTARAQHVMPLCRDHMTASGQKPIQAYATKPPRRASRSMPDFRLARPLSDMSYFSAELCENCADIAPIVPSLRGIP